MQKWMSIQSSLIMTQLLLLLMVCCVVWQVNGQDAEPYCATLADSSSSQTNTCHDKCERCFGPAPDQCFECLDDVMGVAIDVQDLCRDTIVAEELVNVTGVVNCSAETSSLTEMDIIIIGAAAGGGGGLLLCALLITCCCCCCCIRRKRKKKSFDMHSEEHGAPIVPREVTSFAVENKNLTRDSSQDNEFEMQTNTELSVTTKVSSPVRITSPASLSSPSVEPKSEGSRTVPATEKLPLSPPKDKGYVKMVSAGTVRRDLESREEEDGIYVEADGTPATIALVPPPSSSPPPPITSPAAQSATLSHTAVLSSNTAPTSSKKHAKPATLPKPKVLQANAPPALPASCTTSPSPVPVHAELKPPATDKEESMETEDDYVLPEVFRQDIKKQKAENYYNKDAVIVPERRRAATPTKDSEPQTIYANVDPGVEDSGSETDKSDKEHLSYENVREYLTDGATETTGGDASEYYNLPDVNKTCPEEDNMYVYMKSGQNIDQDTPSPSADRKRLESEPTGKTKKYINFSREQELASSGQQQRGKGKDLDEQSEETPLYANVDETEEEDLYTEVT